MGCILMHFGIPLNTGVIDELYPTSDPHPAPDCIDELYPTPDPHPAPDCEEIPSSFYASDLYSRDA
jgi:hypothetical protein